MESVPSLARPRTASSSWVSVALSVGVGVLVGLATSIGQGFMPGQWNTLVNSGAIWLVPVFFVGARMSSRGRSAIAGVITLLATVAGYYGSAALAGAPISLRSIALWVVVGLVAGPLYGLAGLWWRDKRRVFRIAGVALLGGVLVAEGFYIVLVLQYYWSGWTMVLTGVVASVLLSRRDDRLRTLIAVPVPALAGGAVYAALNWVLQRG